MPAEPVHAPVSAADALATAMAISGYADPDPVEQWALPKDGALAVLAYLKSRPDLAGAVVAALDDEHFPAAPPACGHGALIDGDNNCPDCGAPVIYR